MAKLILPDDPLWHQPLVMGNPYDGLTPKTKSEKRLKELEAAQSETPGNFKYGASVLAHHSDPWVKTAQMAGQNSVMTNPMWFSPLHTAQNWQIASKRREVLMWARFFAENEPKVAAAIDFYSMFPMNGFDFECEDNKISAFFKYHVEQKLRLNAMFKMISREYFMLGDVFLHSNIKCEICHGSAIDPETGEMCHHPNGIFDRLILLNPDWIEVQQNALSSEPSIVMVPDEELKHIVFYKQPRQIYDRIPDNIKQLVLQGKPIPLSNRTTSHLKHMPCGYGTYGTSLIRRLFTTLAYKTKLMTANWIVAERLILPVRVVKIGSDARPASSADIADVQQMLSSSANDPNLTIVTHHNFEYEWYGACHDTETEVLTSSGFKTYDQVDITKDKIMCYDVYTKELRLQFADDKHEYEYDGEMIHFYGKQVDIKVTPNHKMLFRKNMSKQWRTALADDIVPGTTRFLCHGLFSSECKVPKFVQIENDKIDIKTFLRFAGYYISEGGCSRWSVKISQSENANADICRDIEDCLKNTPYKFGDYREKNSKHSYTIYRVHLKRYCDMHFGNGAYRKHIPQWIKDLPPKYLEIIMETLINGDGTDRENIHTTQHIYTTVSKQLANDVQEIAIKCDYHSIIRLDNSTPGKLFYKVGLSKGLWSKGHEPRIKYNHIKKVPYKGKVWCFTVPTGFFVTRRNGKITIQGNSGKILQVTQELEWVDKEILDGFMLNQSLLNGEMCLTPEHEVLTQDGYKKINEVSLEDNLCQWNDERECYIYEQPKHLIKYDNVSEIYEIKSGSKVLFRCTGEHKIAIKRSNTGNYYPSKHDKITAQKLFETQSKVSTLLYGGSYIQITSVEKVSYSGPVYCFETTTGFFVAKYKNTEFISSNSGYQSAQVGVETLIRRLETWRHTLAEWCEENIFKPIAEMQGFIDKEKSEEVGETVYLYPRIKWNDLQLRDKTPRHQILLQLHDKQVISTQTLMEELDLNYDQEVKRQRYEQLQAGTAGAALGGQGGAQGGAGMGGAGGGGGAPPGGDMGAGGAPPGGDMGMGGAPGGAPGGDMGGGGAGGMGATAGAGGKVMKKGKNAKEEQEQQGQVGFIKLTGLEQKMAEMLTDVANANRINPQRIRVQYPVENPNGGQPYRMDFSMPDFKIGIECLHPETTIMTKSGVKQARHIDANDILFDRFGHETKLINKFVGVHQGEACRIQARGIIPFTVTDKHKLLTSKPKHIRVKRHEPAITRTRDYVVPCEAEFVYAKDILPGDYLLFPKNNNVEEITRLDTSVFNESRNIKTLPDSIELTADFGRLLGFYTAEGDSSKNTICFSFNKKEIEYIEEVQILIKNIFGINKGKTHTDIENNSTRALFSSKALSKFFLEHAGKLAPNKKIPDFMYYAPRECKLAYLQACSDGDGCPRNEHQYRIQTSSIGLALGIQKLAASIGVWADIAKSRDKGIYNIRGKTGPQKWLWDVNLNFSPKCKNYREDDTYFYIRVRHNNHIPYNSLVYNFETEDHTYCINNIVSKNCDGELWHSTQKQAVSDKERDNLLAQRGWTVLRFTDKSIDEAPHAVKQTIQVYLQKAFEKHSKKTASVQSSISQIEPAHLFILKRGELTDLEGNYDRYEPIRVAQSLQGKPVSEVIGSRETFKGVNYKSDYKKQSEVVKQ